VTKTTKTAARKLPGLRKIENFCRSRSACDEGLELLRREGKRLGSTQKLIAYACREYRVNPDGDAPSFLGWLLDQASTGDNGMHDEDDECYCTSCFTPTPARVAKIIARIK
jgi:hypothetical protein